MAATTNAPALPPEPAAMQPEHPGNAPVHSARHRALKAAVWRNETENGVFFNTTVSRSYKDKEDDTWKESSSFGYDDEETALHQAKRMANARWFEGDYVRVITRDGELVWEWNQDCDCDACQKVRDEEGGE